MIKKLLRCIGAMATLTFAAHGQKASFVFGTTTQALAAAPSKGGTTDQSCRSNRTAPAPAGSIGAPIYDWGCIARQFDPTLPPTTLPGAPTGPVSNEEKWSSTETQDKNAAKRQRMMILLPVQVPASRTSDTGR